MFWGISEALDLVEEYQKNNSSVTESLNILLYGSCDPRHILKTAAKSYKHDIQINFYVVDGCTEVYARNIALLAIAFENSVCLSLLQKIHLFMDVYGNLLLRPSSYQYLCSKAKFLLQICTDLETREKMAPIIDIELLKYRERDGLENAFNFWLPKKNNQFDILQHWEKRNRELLKTRYDCRDGAFDWDHQMYLKDRGATQICSQEYKTWRHTGVAFTYPEYEQCYANKTLAAGLIRNGSKYHYPGYIGDIQTGPFCTFGLKCGEPSMLQSMHGENDYRATEVTERNLLELFHEIQAKTEYVHDKSVSRKYGNTILKGGKNFLGLDNESIKVLDYNQPMVYCPKVKIYFLSMDTIFDLQENKRWKNCFDIVFVAQNYFCFLKIMFVNILRKDSLMLFETNLYTICRKEQLNEFVQKVKCFATDAKLKCLTNFNINLKHSILKYKFTFDKEY